MTTGQAWNELLDVIAACEADRDALKQRVSILTTEMDAAIAAKDEAERKLSALADEYVELELEHRGTVSSLAMVNAGFDGAWHWQGDGCDRPESLSCPVVMSADTLSEIIAAKDEACDLAADALSHLDATIARERIAELRAVGNTKKGGE